MKLKFLIEANETLEILENLESQVKRGECSVSFRQKKFLDRTIGKSLDILSESSSENDIAHNEFQRIYTQILQHCFSIRRMLENPSEVKKLLQAA